MVTFPNAKINIGLNIISRREDGYHNIESIMTPIPWCDILEIVPSNNDTTTLTITGREVNCPVEKNLVMKAYRAMEARYNLPAVEIYLHKIIPDGAGLGGGSADAAFTITLLNDLFNINATKEELAEIAATIGADCPFFIYNKTKLATGIGTEFTNLDLDLSGYKILVVKPQVSVPTAQAYAGVTPQEPQHSLPKLIEKDINTWQEAIKNDFEKSIFNIHPIVAQIKQQIIDLGAIYASMSGSGSAIYGIFENDKLSEDTPPTFDQCDIFIGNL